MNLCTQQHQLLQLNEREPSNGYILLFAYHSRVWVLRSVAERRRQSGRAAFIVMGVLAVVNGAVNGYRPHAGRVSVTVTVIIFAAVAARPNVNIPFAIASLNRASENRIRLSAILVYSYVANVGKYYFIASLDKLTEPPW